MWTVVFTIGNTFFPSLVMGPFLKDRRYFDDATLSFLHLIKPFEGVH